MKNPNVSPLEIASAAAFNKAIDQAGRTIGWDGEEGFPGEEEKQLWRERMHAALLALSEAKTLPNWTDDGKASYRVTDAEKLNFRRMCLAIAEELK